MYYIAKIAQAAGLAVTGIGFLLNFPHLMSHKVFLVGILLFGFGWVIQRFCLR